MVENLVMSIRRHNKMIVFCCDYCDQELETEETEFEEAREVAKDQEWLLRKKDGEWLNFCSQECVKEFYN